jgi:hypothetical protein
MRRSARWLVAWSVTAVAFAVFLWLAKVFSFSWEPRDQSDRWVIATAFASVMAGAVIAALGWWAGREPPSQAGSRQPNATIHGGTSAPPEARIFGLTTHFGSGDINQSGGNMSITKLSASKEREGSQIPRTGDNNSRAKGE